MCHRQVNTGRNLAATAAKYMGQTIMVQNIVGASGTIRSQADTEKFAREQYEMYERLGTTLGLRK